MINVLKIILFTVLVTAFYAYIGQMVPQKEVHPPKDLEVRADMTTDDLVQAGQEIVGGKGTCLGCHTIGSDKPGRFPDLGGIGARAGKQRPGMSDVEYLAQSIYEPNAFIVEGYSPGMPPIHGPPINLSDGEIMAVIAYLQSLGGTPNVTMLTRHAFSPSGTVANDGPAAPAASAATTVPRTAKELLTVNGCAGCHRLDQPGKLVGPSLFDVGKRLKPSLISESIMDPDAVTPKGYPKGLMANTLKASGFYDKTSAGDIKAMVAYLSAQRGKR
ncbi:MAG: c-type cytochrome [Fibrobacteria bacterium]